MVKVTSPVQLRSEGADMARVPIDQTRRSRVPRDREALWTKIRELRKFTVSDLFLISNMDRRSIKQFVVGLANAGILEQEDMEYTLIKDLGKEAPRIRMDGSIVPPTKSERIWRSIRILNQFDARDVLMAANSDEDPITEAYVRDYLRNLHKAGYLSETRPGDPHNLARYVLIGVRYSGPKPPMVQRTTQIFDPNLKKVVWPVGGAS